MRASSILAAILILAARPAWPALTVGLMPAENSYPLVVAQEKGFFTAEGVKVTLTLFTGQLEREAALQSGAVDGSVSDLVNAIQAWANGFGEKVTSASEGAFSLLASPGGKIGSLADWKAAGRRVPTGLIENSVIFLTAERMLHGAGIDPRTMEMVPVIAVPVRMQMLLEGKVEAACLPEPMGAFAAAQGARLIGSSRGLDITPGVILFTSRAVSGKAAEIRAFYRAYDRAVRELAANGAAYRQAIVAALKLPAGLSASLEIPPFKPAFVPGPKDVEEISAWMREKGLLTGSPRPTDIVDPALLPGGAGPAPRG